MSHRHGPTDARRQPDQLSGPLLVRPRIRSAAFGLLPAGCASHGTVSHQLSLAAFASAPFATVAQSCADPPDNVAIVWKPTWYMVPGGLPGIVPAAVQVVPLQLQLAVPLYS